MNWSIKDLDNQCKENPSLAAANGITQLGAGISGYEDYCLSHSKAKIAKTDRDCSVGGKIPHAVKLNSLVANAGGKQKPILEKDFQAAVIDLLHFYGYRVCEFRKARVKKDGVDVYRTPFGADGVGFPDLIAINRKLGSLIVIECKSKIGKPSPEQKEWLCDWAFVNDNVLVLRPDDLEKLKTLLESVKSANHA
jgi:hypothetical protein